jgi:hypothetical protein
LQPGNVIEFGNYGDDKNGLSVYGEISSISSDKVVFVGNEIVGMPMALYDSSLLASKLEDDLSYNLNVRRYTNRSTQTQDDLRAMFTGDLFAVKDTQKVVVQTASDIFKGILGDPLTDIGLNVGAVKTDIKNMFDRGESNFVQMVNWDKFQELIDENTIAGIEYTYNQKDGAGVDVLKLLTNICLTFGLQQVWEYSPTNKTWWLTFDEFKADNVATAVLKGRSVDVLDIAANEISAIVGGGWYYNRLMGKYKGVGGDDIELNYQLTDGRIGHTLKDKTLGIEDTVTLLPIESEAAQDEILKKYATMLRQFSQVVYNQKLILNLRKTAVIGVGRWLSVDWPPVQNRQTGKRNDGDLVGQLQSMTINLSTGLINVGLLSYPSIQKGIAPSFYADTVSKSSNTVTITGLSTNPANNDFGDTDSLLTDLAYFGCIDEVAGELVDRNCSCTGYRVTIFERKPDNNELFYDPLNAYVNQNVFRGTIDALTVATLGSSVDIELDGNGTAFDITKDWVVIFADRADAGLQQCQLDLYGWLSDSNNQVTDGSIPAVKSSGITIGV